MFKRLWPIDKQVEFHFEERLIRAQEGDSVAAALLSAGVTAFRQQVESGEMRGPYCMIGNCFECRIEIDGMAGRQACRERVRDGMRVRLQRGLRIEGGEDDG